MAEPVSWAIIRRSKLAGRFSLASGSPVWMKNGVPYTCSELSTAIERPGVYVEPPGRRRPLGHRTTRRSGKTQTIGFGAALPRRFADLRASTHRCAPSQHLLARDYVALDENAADRNVRVSVVGIVGDPQHRSVFQSHAGRALDLNHQGVRRILDPADLEMSAVKGAVEDLASIVVGHQFAAGSMPQRLSFVGKPGAGAVWRRHQIPRATVDRDFEDSSYKLCDPSTIGS